MRLDPLSMTVAFMLLVCVALILVLVARRVVLGRYLRWRIDKVAEWGAILDQIIARMDEPRPAEMNALMPEGPFTRSVLEEILLTRMDLLTGRSRMPLIKVFQQSTLLNRCAADLHDRNVDRRRKAADIIGRAAGRDYAGLLVTALKDSDSTVRMIAARGLGRMGIQTAAPAMVYQLEVMEERQCLVIVDALINLGMASLTPLSLALTSASEQKRYYAGLAISHICETGRCQMIIINRMPRRRATDVPATFPSDLPGRLVRLTWDQSPRVRRVAITALASLQTATSVPRVEKLLAGDPEPEVRQAAAGALSLLARSESATPLLDALNDPSWDVQRQAAHTLSELGGPWLDRLHRPEYRDTAGVRWLSEIEADVE